MKKFVIVFLALLTFVQVAAAQPVVDYMHINADVNNGYAVTTVEEKLSNQMGVPANDEFKFLIPEEAFISGFSGNNNNSHSSFARAAGKHDYEYERRSMCIAGKRMVEVTERKTKTDWAHFIEKIAARYETAEKIKIVMDNLNTHEWYGFC